MCSKSSHAPGLPSPGRAEGDVRAPAALRSARARRPRGEPGTAAAGPRRPPTRRAAHLAGHQRLDLLHDGPAAAPTALSGRARRRGTAEPCWAPPDRARPRLPGSGSSGRPARLQAPTARPGGRAGPGAAAAPRRRLRSRCCRGAGGASEQCSSPVYISKGVA